MLLTCCCCFELVFDLRKPKRKKFDADILEEELELVEGDIAVKLSGSDVVQWYR